jgi:type II secretory pathway component PulF
MTEDQGQRRASLSDDEAAELGSLLSTLVKSGFPLAAGLEAAARELPRGRLSRSLAAVSRQLRQGESLETAIAAKGRALPEHVQALVAGGLRTARLGEVIDEFVAIERRAVDIRRAVLQSLAYPTILLAILVAVVSFFSVAVVPGLARVLEGIGESFGDTFQKSLPLPSKLLIGMSDSGPWILTANLTVVIGGWLLAWLSLEVAEFRSILNAVPLVGPISRWAGLAQFSRLMALLVESELPLPAALKLAGRGSRDADLAAAGLSAARRIEAGDSLAQALAGLRPVPKSLRPIIEWGERAGAVPEAFRTAAEMFEGRLAAQVALVCTVVPPFTFLAVLWVVLFLLTAVVLPMMIGINAFSWPPAPSSPSWMAPFTSADMGSAESYPGLVLLGVAVLFSLRLFYRAHADDPQDPLHVALTVAGRTMIATGIVDAVLLCLSWFAILFLVAAGAVFVVAFLRFRSRRRASLLTVMATAARKWVPLPPAIAAFAAEWRGGFGHRAHWLASRLAQGVPLSDALRQVRGLISPKALAVIEVGTQTGMLSGMLDVAAALDAPREARLRVQRALEYFVGLAAVAIGVIVFVMTKIIPEYIKIFEDFEVELPGLTLALIDVFRFFVEYPLLLAPPTLLAFAALGYLALRQIGAVDWDPPLVDGFMRRLDVASLLRVLAVVAEAGRPLEVAIAALACHWPRNSVRVRLARVLADVQMGDDWRRSMRQHGLLSGADAALLESAARLGNLSWALRETAAGSERKIAYRLMAGLQVAIPALVLVFGGIVMTFVVGLFWPLCDLIESMA